MSRCTLPSTSVLLAAVHFAAVGTRRNLLPNASPESVTGTNAMPECRSVWKEYPDLLQVGRYVGVAPELRNSGKVLHASTSPATTNAASGALRLPRPGNCPRRRPAHALSE